MTAYCLYSAFSGAFSDSVYHPEAECQTCILLLLYIVIRCINTGYTSHLLLLFSISAIIRLIYSIHTQLHGFLPGIHLYQMKGGFLTTSLWGGFLSLVLTLYVGTGIFGTFFRNSAFRQYLWYCGCFLFTILLFYSDSRAAWVSTIAGIGMLLCIRYRKTIRFLFRKHRISTIGILLLSLYFGALFLYQHKPDSARGRLQIHRITCDMIKTRPLAGFGTGGFSQHYMDYQAAYFKTHPNIPDSSLADEITFAFNEYLKLFTEQGIIRGVAIVGIFLFIAMRKPRTKTVIASVRCRSALLALAVFSCFSYPFSCFEFKFFGTFLLACIVSDSRNDLPLRCLRPGSCCLSACFVLLAGCFTACLCIRQEQAYRKWMHALQHYSVSPTEALHELHDISSLLYSQPVFLFTYGKALNFSGRYSEALTLLNRASEYRASYQILIETGKSHAGTGHSEAARRCWEKAGEMIPNRLLPGYLTARMYEQNHQTGVARRIAEETLHILPKTDNPESRKIRRELLRIASLK